MLSPLSRRRFLQASAASLSLAATDLTLRQVWAADDKQPRKLAHCLSDETYSLRDLILGGKLTLLTAAALHKKLDIKGVSLNDMYFKSWDKAYLDKILDSFKANDRVITCLIMEGNLATANEAARRKQIDSNTAKLKAAGYLGIPVVRMNLGQVGPGEDNRKEGVDRCIAAFKEMLPLARDLGIRITIENHGGVSGTVGGILAVINGTDPKWVGSLLDFGNPPVHERPEVFAKLAPYAYHCHAKLEDFKEDGEATNADYGKLLGILKARNYPGAVSIEWEGRNHKAVEGVKLTRALILRHWPELPN
ncbi:MAG TPA: sugar phosphate isomerase/epimerase family protein [Gemmataceae bacterium]|nr:sugar phosphate isomerase/epimerase family protein [Gemmataceae bacterium]